MCESESPNFKDCMVYLGRLSTIPICIEGYSMSQLNLLATYRSSFNKNIKYIIIFKILCCAAEENFMGEVLHACHGLLSTGWNNPQALS